MSKKNSIRIGFTVLLAGIFLFLIFRQVKIDELHSAFAAASWPWYLAAVASFIFGYICRIERWRLMLNSENQALSWRDCAGPFLSCVAANNVFPFRSGDFLRSFAFNQRLGISTGVAVSSLFVERVLDMFALMLFLSIALFYFDSELINFLRISGAAALMLALLLFSILLFPSIFRPLLLAMLHFLGRIVPKHEQRLRQELDKGLESLTHLAKAHMMMRLVNWTLIAWLAEGCVYWLTALALPSIINVAAAWLALPVATLATLIPSTPGYVGTFDYFSFLSLTALGNSPASATAFTLLVHIALWLPATAVGAIFLTLGQVKPPQRFNSDAKVDNHGNKLQ